jgi:hypothetical protein
MFMYFFAHRLGELFKGEYLASLNVLSFINRRGGPSANFFELSVICNHSQRHQSDYSF